MYLKRILFVLLSLVVTIPVVNCVLKYWQDSRINPDERGATNPSQRVVGSMRIDEPISNYDASEWKKYHPYGGDLLLQALRDVLDPIIENGVGKQKRGFKKPPSEDEHSSFWQGNDGAEINFKSKLRRRCNNYLACETHVPVVEIENAIIRNGALYLNDPDDATYANVENLRSFFASKPNALPSSLAGGTVPWVIGPEIFMSNAQNAAYKAPPEFNGVPGDTGSTPMKCDKVWDTTAFFLFPWEIQNAFHSMNDNLFSVLASVVVQYITDATHYKGMPRTKHRTLFLFHPPPNKSNKATVLNKLLLTMFGGDVQSPYMLFYPDLAGAKASHVTFCIRRMVWGTSMKPFYKDGLWKLRKILYSVFRRVNQLTFGSHLVPETRSISGPKSSQNKPLRVVLISRNDGGFAPVKSSASIRSMSASSEQQLLDGFKNNKAGVQVSAMRCCEWGKISTPKEAFEALGDMDVCISVHGAGLSNCIMGPPDMVVLEMQVTGFSYFGFDSYVKVAHMLEGTHVMFVPERLTRRGIEMDDGIVSDITETVIGLARKTTEIDQSSADAVKHVVKLDVQYESNIIVTTDEPHTNMQYWSPLEVLGPMGAPDAPYGSLLVPYSSTGSIPSLLTYTSYCKTLPYYQFRQYALKLIRERTKSSENEGVIESKSVISEESFRGCDSARITRKNPQNLSRLKFLKIVKAHINVKNTSYWLGLP